MAIRHEDQPLDPDFIEQQAYFQTAARVSVKKLTKEQESEVFKSIYARLWKEMEQGVKKGQYL